jgi:Tfp pilus assembly protein PilN
MSKFPKKCASSKLHDEDAWAIGIHPLMNTRKVPSATKYKLLELCGKSMKRDYTQSTPWFCEGCVEEVQKRYPVLNEARLKKLKASGPDQVVLDQETTCERLECSGAHDAKGSQQMEDVPQVMQKWCPDSAEPEFKRARVSIPGEFLTYQDLQEAETSEQLLSTQNTEDRQPVDNVGNIAQIAANEKKEMKKTAHLLSKQRSLSDLCEINLESLKKSNPVVEAFLTELSPKVIQKKHMYQLCKTVESILNLTSMNQTLPLHFRESVILYSMTGSRLALKVLGAGGAHSSYNAVKTWLDSLASSEVKVMAGDLIIAFDNNQILQRRWKVQLRNGVHCHVVTVVVHFLLEPKGKIQENAALKPTTWAAKPLTPEQKTKISKIDQDKEVKMTHYEFQHPYLKRVIEIHSASS